MAAIGCLHRVHGQCPDCIGHLPVADSHDLIPKDLSEIGKLTAEAASKALTARVAAAHPLLTDDATVKGQAAVFVRTMPFSGDLIDLQRRDILLSNLM
jgi:hypothetical protein